ncbi:MAG: cell division protein SepF [Defluviitaleaceae bacterium]|nr:cell division protein SepF [Defluviitaleaceae bacterium]
MEFIRKLRDGLMGVEYEREEDEYDYVEEYEDEESESEPSGIFASFNRRKENVKAQPVKRNARETTKETSRISGFDTYEPSSRQSSSKRASLDSKVLSLPSSNNYRGAAVAEEIVICRPETLEDARPVCEYLKNNVICVISLESVDKAIAQRIADFLSGACDALDGGIQRISHDIFLIAPANIAITSQVREELKKNGVILPWIQGAFR